MYFIIGSLAVWRLAKMLQDDIGPLAIFGKLRQHIDKLNNHEGGLREGFYCFNCITIWMGILIMALYLINVVLFYLIAVPLAYSALAIIINHAYNKE